MPLLLPIEIERCLFLDVDIIINDDISSLYNIDLNNNIIAAAEDIPDCIDFKPRLGLSQTDFYINSGVMVCDILKWRELEAKRPIIKYAVSIKDIIQNDQDVIAVYFKDKLKILPIRWNMVTFYFMRKPKIFNRYINDLPQAKHAPGIIHFCAPIKPWYKDCDHPYRKLYQKYRNKTSWKAEKSFPVFEALNAKQRFYKKIKNFLNSLNILQDSNYLIR